MGKVIHLRSARASREVHIHIYMSVVVPARWDEERVAHAVRLALRNKQSDLVRRVVEALKECDVTIDEHWTRNDDDDDAV